MRLLKKERTFTILIIPHSEDSVFSFRLSLFCFQLICLLVMGSIVFTLFTYKNFRKAEKKLTEMQEIQLENYFLRENMDLFAQETEELKMQLSQMSILSSEIKSLAENSPLEQQSAEIYLKDPAFSRNKVAGRGGNQVLDRVYSNISILQQSIPQKTEELNQLKDDLEEQQRKKNATPSIWPIKGIISSFFGPRRSPFNGGKEIHYGLDIAAPQGTPIYAAANGKVIQATYRRGTGNVIIIDHGYSFKTLYAHLSRLGVRKGENVHKGQVIGYVGSTGLSTGPHLHYEVHVKGVAVNPMDYLN